MLMNSQRDVAINVGQFGIMLSAVTFTKVNYNSYFFILIRKVIFMQIFIYKVMKTSYSFCTFLRQIL